MVLGVEEAATFPPVAIARRAAGILKNRRIVIADETRWARAGYD
jgi:hypothetical protein